MHVIAHYKDGTSGTLDDKVWTWFLDGVAAAGSNGTIASGLLSFSRPDNKTLMVDAHLPGSVGVAAFVGGNTKDDVASDVLEIISLCEAATEELCVRTVVHADGTETAYRRLFRANQVVNLMARYPGANFIVEKDIDLGYQNLSERGLLASLEGHYNANGKRILRYASNVAPFRTIAATGRVSNLTMEWVSIGRSTDLTNDYVGGIADVNEGTIADSAVTGGISRGRPYGGRTYWNYTATGGIAGLNRGVIERSRSGAGVSMYETYRYIYFNVYLDSMGGIAGINEGTIRNSTFDGSANSSHFYVYVGGLAGTNRGVLETGAAAGSVAGARGNIIGGAVGLNDGGGRITRVEATGSLHFTGSWYWSGRCCDGSSQVASGGLVGRNSGAARVERSSSRGHNFVGYGYGNYTYGGGLIGQLFANWDAGGVSDSFATGDVHNVYAGGGLVAYNSNGRIENCYSTGGISAAPAGYVYGWSPGNWLVGGLIGGTWNGIVRGSFATGAVSGVSSSGLGAVASIYYSGDESRGLTDVAYRAQGTQPFGQIGLSGTGKEPAAAAVESESAFFAEIPKLFGWDVSGTWLLNAGELPKLK